MKKKHTLYLIMLMVVCLMFVLFSPFLAKKYGEKMFFDVSPDKKYRVETLKVASFYFGAMKMNTPGFVRAYDANGSIFYESDIFDLQDNCRIFWPNTEDKEQGILVGVTIFIPIY